MINKWLACFEGVDHNLELHACARWHWTGSDMVPWHRILWRPVLVHPISSVYKESTVLDELKQIYQANLSIRKPIHLMPLSVTYTQSYTAILYPSGFGLSTPRLIYPCVFSWLLPIPFWNGYSWDGSLGQDSRFGAQAWKMGGCVEMLVGRCPTNMAVSFSGDPAWKDRFIPCDSGISSSRLPTSLIFTGECGLSRIRFRSASLGQSVKRFLKYLWEKLHLVVCEKEGWGWSPLCFVFMILWVIWQGE